MSHEPAWLVIARKELGVHETPGPKATARIIEYGQATTLKATSDEVPWCASFVNWCIREARKSHPELDKETGSAAAVSWRKWGHELQWGRIGCVVVFKFVNGRHHVGFYVGEDVMGVFCLGGNQNDSVSIKHFPWDSVINFRWPDEYKEVT